MLKLVFRERRGASRRSFSSTPAAQADIQQEWRRAQQAIPLAKAALENLTAAGIKRPCDEQGQPLPIPNTADSGYFSEPNVTGVAALGLDPYYATGRQKHHASEEPATPVATDPATTDPATTEFATTEFATTEFATTESATTKPSAPPVVTPKEAMKQKLQTELGRKLYAARKHIVEPVFGQIKRVRGFRKFSQRGLERIRAEWQLICATHNLLKIWRYILHSH